MITVSICGSVFIQAKVFGSEGIQPCAKESSQSVVYQSGDSLSYVSQQLYCCTDRGMCSLQNRVDGGRCYCDTRSGPAFGRPCN